MARARELTKLINTLTSSRRSPGIFESFDDPGLNAKKLTKEVRPKIVEVPTRDELEEILDKKGYSSDEIGNILHDFGAEESPDDDRLNHIRAEFIIPSACYTVDEKNIKFKRRTSKAPEVGDLVYGSIKTVGEHNTLENVQGRIHTIGIGTKSIFVFGNRYAPDAFEGVVPKKLPDEVDLLARSGLIGKMTEKNTIVGECSTVRVHGYVCDKSGKVINTRDYPMSKFPPTKLTATKKNMILCIGSSMNSGKSTAAAQSVWGLSSLGHKVNSCKVTGTASLKDILLAKDSGADRVADFTRLGYPSTYKLSEKEIVDIFIALCNEYGDEDYWVVEIADGIRQRETSILLGRPEVQNKIHKMIFCAQDALGISGGIQLLQDKFGLVPAAISGPVAGSQLALSELEGKIKKKIPAFDSMTKDLKAMVKILF